MANEPSQYSPMFRIDVSPEGQATHGGVPVDSNVVVIALLRQMLQFQDKQNQLLEQLVAQSAQQQKQRNQELQQWRDANPRLAKSCRSAAETLSRVQTEFLSTMTEEITEHEEDLVEGEFMLNEFVDRFGPRLAHLNGVLQVLAQLGTIPAQNP